MFGLRRQPVPVAEAVEIVLEKPEPVATVHRRYLSFSIDISVLAGGYWWEGSNTSRRGLGTLRVPPLNLNRKKLDRLVRALPPLLWLERGDWESPLFSVLCEEVVEDRPGQAAVLDRLIDLVLMRVLRAWFSRPDTEEPAWYRSRADPVVGRALSAIHSEPSRPWTVAALAAEAGVSRAALARRFQEVVGEPPMTFLTQWRLALAADLLCEPDATVGTVAPRVGYSSPYALSSAFKRVRGVSPQEHRARASSA